MVAESALGEPFEAEAALVNAERVAKDAARWLIRNAIPHIGKSRWLATRTMDYRRFQSLSHAMGALPPESAQFSLTRRESQKRWARQKARRSGRDGLLTAIRSS